MYLEIDAHHLDATKVNWIVDQLKSGAIIVMPTDTVYAMCCAYSRKDTMDRMAALKGNHKSKTQFSIIIDNLEKISTYTKPFDRSIFRILNKALPGPYTFILEASNEVYHNFKKQKHTVGIRMPDSELLHAIISLLGQPLVTTSIGDDSMGVEFATDPKLIESKYGDKVEAIVDAGFGNITPSTVIDLTGESPEVIREGAGSLEVLN
ncbi:MAG: threonylcarbamoyl-AMP synthase [Bacteroidetes bacterium]|nr:threonylcarbamoyl-AMP synthase [Bacteroidota bacterium]